MPFYIRLTVIQNVWNLWDTYLVDIRGFSKVAPRCRWWIISERHLFYVMYNIWWTNRMYNFQHDNKLKRAGVIQIYYDKVWSIKKWMLYPEIYWCCSESLKNVQHPHIYSIQLTEELKTTHHNHHRTFVNWLLEYGFGFYAKLSMLVKLISYRQKNISKICHSICKNIMFGPFFFECAINISLQIFCGLKS